MRVFSIFVLTLGVALVFGFAIAAEKAPETAKPAWKISGHLEEACKCNAACPCWFGSKPTNMNCGGQLAYFITKGTYGNVSLDNLSFARMGQSPDGQSMMESSGNWVFDYLYVDEKATPEQRKALEAVAWAMEPPESKNVKTQYVAITRQIEGKEHHISIGKAGTFSAHLIEGLNGVPKIVNAPGADPIRASFEQGQTSAFRYTDASQDWNTKGSNYMYTDYTVTSEQYAAFGAKMAKMMEEKKKQKQ
ncbi:MAG TPA: DUF1326 domain-containing protein [Acidobacteriota bacterium]|nr:DUF1326 domain-containing protein [Acidobacteriota bacterium]